MTKSRKRTVLLHVEGNWPVSKHARKRSSAASENDVRKCEIKANSRSRLIKISSVPVVNACTSEHVSRTRPACSLVGWHR